MSVSVIRNGKIVELSPDEGAKYILKLLKEGKIRYNLKKQEWDSNNGKGWKGESMRHSLSAQGIKTNFETKIGKRISITTVDGQKFRGKLRSITSGVWDKKIGAEPTLNIDKKNTSANVAIRNVK